MAGRSDTSRSNAANITEEMFSQVSRDGFSWRPTHNFQSPPPGRGATRVDNQWYRSMDNGTAHGAAGVTTAKVVSNPAGRK